MYPNLVLRACVRTCSTNNVSTKPLTIISTKGPDNHQLNKDIKDARPVYTPDSPASLDDPPTTCCMSGCPNCVYIAWAEALSKQMTHAEPSIAKKILENVDDPSMKAFLQMELRSLGILK